MTTGDLPRSLAIRVIKRWQYERYDSVGVDPSGYCYPINSAPSPEEVEGHDTHAIGSPEAVEAVATAIREGATYNFREMGEVVSITFDTLVALHDLRVLVVDDRPDTRELLVVVLETCGAEATAAASAEEALRAYGEGPPDLLVADIMMPGQDGLSLMREIRSRESPGGARLPAVALTALDSDRDRAAIADAGFDVYMAKPVEPARLGRAIAELVRE